MRVAGHWEAWEFECPHCLGVMLDPVLLARLELLRIFWGGALLLSSGYRCRIWNADPTIDGLADSRHLSGRAVDIPIMALPARGGPGAVAGYSTTGVPREEFARFRAAAVKAGFRDADVVDEGDHVHLEVA